MSSKPAVLIAALSGRALAQSARRAGFIPFVVDAFGDDDMRTSAGAFETLPSVVTTGFTSRVLRAALKRQVEKAETDPVGLVLGSGFDDRPRLVDRLARDYRVFGSLGPTIENVKDPFILQRSLSPLGVRFPAMSKAAPQNAKGWLSKRRGATGGGHIIPADALRGQGQGRRYFQEYIDGNAVSVLVACADGRTYVIGLSKQWCVGSGTRPFRYAGAMTQTVHDETHDRLLELTRRSAEVLGLRGLASFDYIIKNGEPYLLEVNPRPGATLDIFDDGGGSLFKLHMGHGDAIDAFTRSPAVRIAALLYNDAEQRTMPLITWPDWAFDRTPAGQPILPEEPIASVQADGDTMDVAQTRMAERLASLRELIYTSMKRNSEEKRHYVQVTNA